MAVFAAPAAVDRIQLEIMRDELEDVRGEINSLIGQIEAVREDLYEKRSGLGSMCCCCRRRDLRKLEDRLWLRLHQLQEKENELHRQRTAILSRSLLPGAAGDLQSPLLRQQPPPVSPEAPESPPWQQQQQHECPPLPDRRQLAPSATAAGDVENHVALPMRIVVDAGAAPVERERSAQPPRQRQPSSATRPLSLRRRPCRPGSAEDTGSGAE